MLWKTHVRISFEVLRRLGISLTDEVAQSFKNGIVAPDQWKDFPHHHGKSEILLTIEKPDGRIVVLRDGPHFFDPYNISHLTIEPGESKQFYVGWFFLNARGRWDDDSQAAIVFTEKGHYRVTLLYRNLFPRGFVYDTSTGKSSSITVWTGEIQSNTVTVEIK